MRGSGVTEDCDDCLYQNNWTTAEKLTVAWSEYSEVLLLENVLIKA